MSNKMEVERVIFRREWNEYLEAETLLAVFPDDDALPGRVGCVPFYFMDDGSVIWYEPYNEMVMEYYYADTKPVKDMKVVERCLRALAGRYGGEFKAVQKIMRR